MPSATIVAFPKLSRLQLLYIVLVAERGLDEARDILSMLAREYFRNPNSPVIQQYLEQYKDKIKELKRELQIIYPSVG